MTPEEIEKRIEALEERVEKQEAFNKRYLIPLAVAIAYVIGVDFGFILPTPG